MQNSLVIWLERQFFVEKKIILVRFKDLEACIFRYDSGVEAVRIQNQFGYIIMLPFLGQQIWDAYFYDRRLTMKSTFKEPIKTGNFLHTYGAFLMHCGALRMGCPSPCDTHPLHGELPCANYQQSILVAGEDIYGKYVGISGVYEYNVAFGDYYQAVPTVKLYDSSTLIHVEVESKNLSAYPMELMYMAHVNFRPAKNGKIIQCLGWTKEHMKLRENLPSHVRMSKKYIDFVKMLKDNPRHTETINTDDPYSPEIVFFLRHPKVDNEGRTHFLQVHPDGSSDYISYYPDELDHAARWIVLTKNQEALGLALPATADPEGYLAEKEKGNIKELAPGEMKKFHIFTGYLDTQQTEDMKKHINTIITS